MSSEGPKSNPQPKQETIDRDEFQGDWEFLTSSGLLGEYDSFEDAKLLAKAIGEAQKKLNKTGKLVAIKKLTKKGLSRINSAGISPSLLENSSCRSLIF